MLHVLLSYFIAVGDLHDFATIWNSVKHDRLTPKIVIIKYQLTAHAENKVQSLKTTQN